MNRRLYRSYDDRVLAGVAGGIAETYDFDPALVRVGWVLLTLLTGGLFLIVYIAMALVVPLAPDDVPAGWSASQPPAPADPAASEAQTQPAFAAPAPGATSQASWQQPSVSEREWRREKRAQHGARGSEMGGALVIGLLLIGVGGYFLLREYLPAIAWGQLWPVAIIVVGVLLILGAFRRSSR